MIWVIFALLGAFFDATYHMLVKKYVNNVDKTLLASGSMYVGFIALILISLIKGIPTIGTQFWLAVVMVSLLNIAIVMLAYRALQLTDLSLTLPMKAFSLVFVIFTSLIILGEKPSDYGIIGILLIFAGTYVLNISTINKSFFEPIKAIFTNKGVMLMLVSAFIMSISLNYDKMLVTNSDPFFGLAIETLILGTCFLFYSIYKKKPVTETYKNNWKKFLLVGIIWVLIGISMNLAYLTAIVPYAAAIKRVAILIGVIYGGMLFKEKNMTMRIVGSLIIVAGVVLIVVMG